MLTKVQDEPRIAASSNCQSKCQFIIVHNFAFPSLHILQKSHFMAIPSFRVYLISPLVLQGNKNIEKSHGCWHVQQSCPYNMYTTISSYLTYTHPAALALSWWLLKTVASENMNTLLKDAALFFYIVPSFRRERKHIYTHRLQCPKCGELMSIGSVCCDY